MTLGEIKGVVVGGSKGAETALFQRSDDSIMAVGEIKKFFEEWL